MRAAVLFAVCVVPVAFADAETARGHLRDAQRHYGKREFADAVAATTKAVAADKSAAGAYQLRGSAHFMLGKFAESVADFDKVIALDPNQANGHWQRGISLYYAAKYDDGRKQFEGYEKVDTNDVENAVWHFLCVARRDGVEKARGKVLKIGKDARVPMMQVYEMFKGTKKPEDVTAAAEAGEVSAEARKSRRFYANLYLGIYFDVLGETKKAKAYLEKAAADPIDHYMGDVPRVHLLSMERRKP